MHPKKAQQLMRHKSMELTMQVYTAIEIADVAGALESLPDPTSKPAPSRQRATGTAGHIDLQIDLQSDAKRRRGAFRGRDSQRRSEGRPDRKALRSKRLVGNHEAEGTGLEPATGCPAPEFQSGC